MSAPIPPGAPAAPTLSAPPSRRPVRPLPLTQARQRVLSRTGPLAPVLLPASAARGLLLAQAVRATEPAPAADLSAMDGYAVAAASPVPVGACWQVRGETPAGAAAAPRLARDEAVRVFTGAPLPPGTGCVLKNECVALAGDRITVLHPEAADHCRRRGTQHAAGDVVLAAGTRLAALELALIASTGQTRVRVIPPPRVAHLVLGSELVAPDATPGPAQTRDANGALIAALVDAAGATLVAQERRPDDPAAALAAARAFPDHDMLLVSGGAGHGRYDIACAVLEELGYGIEFRAIDIRPGKPLAFATRPGAVAFALPGNPVSHWATWQLLVAPALHRLGRHAVPVGVPCLRGRFAAPWSAAAGDREVWWPAHATAHADGWSLRPLRFAHSGDLTGVAGANALLRLAAAGGHWEAGQPCEFLPCP